MSRGGCRFQPRAYVRHDITTFTDLPAHSFQSTCLREARHYVERVDANALAFQSTCLREARQYLATCRAARRDFNPRAYVRHDIRVDPRPGRNGISIHVPT